MLNSMNKEAKERKPIDRLKDFMNLKGIKTAEFERMIGVSKHTIQSAIQRNGNMSDVTIGKILKTFPTLNYKWLLWDDYAPMEIIDQQDSNSIKQLLANEPNLKKLIDSADGDLKDEIVKLIVANSKLKTELIQLLKLSEGL